MYLKKPLKSFFVLSLFFTAKLFCAEPFSVSASRLDFDGIQTLLQGDVVLHHSDLLIQADLAKLKKSLNHFNFSKAILQDHVVFKFHDDGRIHCSLSRIDFEELQGDLTVEKGQVTYQETLQLGSDPVQIELSCNYANFKLGVGKKSGYFIKQLELVGNLKTHINRAYHLEADQAVIEFGDDELTETPTRITFSKNQLPCRAVHESDFFQADKMAFDLKSHEITCIKLDCAIHHFFAGSLSKTTFKANELKLNEKSMKALLLGPITIQNELFGELKAEMAIEVERMRSDDLLDLKKVKIFGPCEMRHLDHQLTCQGVSEIDLSRRHVTLSSVEKIKKDQTCYQSSNFLVYADTIDLDYKDSFSDIECVHFQGGVLICLEDPEIPAEMAVAEEAFYYPKEAKAILKSTPGNRVLIWKKDEKVSLSADELTIIWDEKNQKKRVQSKGVVRCFLKEDQLSILKSMQKSTH